MPLLMSSIQTPSDMTLDQKIEHPTRVEKETISAMTFPRQDVISAETDRKTRHRHAERAALLGNGYQCKVHIIFMTADEEVKMVETTVWDADDEHITLKSGAIIPVCAILKIEF